MKRQSAIHWSLIVMMSAICCAVLSSLPANGQSEKNATHKTAAQGASVAATPPATQNNDSPIVFPITGKGTTNYIPVFTGTAKIGNSLVSQTGNGITVSGTVGAVSFTGDGSALTDVPAVQLGGLPASAFAQQGASNNFTADQTITGNLNLTGYINSAFSLQGNLTDANGQEGVNVLGGFAGNSQYPGNSIAPGVIGATIGGGGGVYDSNLIPPLQGPAQRQSLQADQAGVRQGRRNPAAQPSVGNGASASRRSGANQRAPVDTGLIPGPNVVIVTQECPYTEGATIAGGLANTASGFMPAVGGGFYNTASCNWSTVAGGEVNTASGVASTVGGGAGNMSSGFVNGVGFATVAGGYWNSSSGDFSTVGGGAENTAQGSAFGGGYATVAGGYLNKASGDYSIVGGGSSNTATGAYASVPGGALNNALGYGSFAAGCNATANYNGSFVWSSYPCNFVSDTTAGQFVADAYGGFYFYTSVGGASGSGAVLPPGSGSWSSLSDRNAKANFLAIDPSALLQKLAAMPVSTWNYKTQADSIRHLGPTAQDFHDAFGLGEDDTHISTVDAEGVALAAVQALYKLNQAKDQQINELKQALEELKAEVAELRSVAASNR